MTCLRPLVVGATIFGSQVAFAQSELQSNDASPPIASASASGASQRSTPPAPAGRTDSIMDGIAFDLSIDGEESQTTVQVGGFVSQTSIVDVQGNARQRNGTWSVTLAIPVGGGDDVTSGSALDALSNGTKLSINLGLFGFRSGDPDRPEFLAFMPLARQACLSNAESDAERTACSEARPDPNFAIEHLPGRRAEINRSYFYPMWRVGLEGSIGVNRFEFIDTATLDDLDETKLQYAVAGYVAHYPADTLNALIGRVEYQNAFEAGDETVVCRPVIVDTAEDCAAGIATPPENVERLNFSAEFRQVIDRGWSLGSIALSPRVTFDALSEDYELELPIYFVPRQDWPVAPGIRLVYSSEKDELDFGIFLRKTFSFR